MPSFEVEEKRDVANLGEGSFQKTCVKGPETPKYALGRLCKVKVFCQQVRARDNKMETTDVVTTPLMSLVEESWEFQAMQHS